MARVQFGIYVSDDGTKLGRGKVALLKAVREHGSISAAARSMGMAYRHAWLMLDELNRTFDDPVIVASTGGPSGGGARLTEWGQELVERYTDMERIVHTSLADHLAALDARLSETPATAGRRRARAHRVS